MEGESLRAKQCKYCGNVGIESNENGSFHCTQCYSEAEDLKLTGTNYEDLAHDDGGALYSRRNSRHQTTAITQLRSHTSAKADESRGFEFSDPTDPGDEDCISEVRMRYVRGLQMMIQSQCEALVKNFKVNRMICGVSGTIWLRFLANTRVFDDISNTQKQGDRRNIKTRAKYRAEPHNLHGQRAVRIWYRYLRNTIPLSCSLAISYLACHIVREAVLPTDIIKWSVEGKLPYFVAFLDIEKQIGPPSRAFPLSSSFMFKPSQTIPVQKLESLAAYIAESIGLHLPPVNFHGIASRYLQQLSLPIEKILPHACKIYEWSMPPDLWLSVNDLRLPTRVGLMSILIVAIRFLYNIHGFGAWEKSFLSCISSSSKADQDHGFDPLTNSRVSDDEDEVERGSGCDGNSSHLQKFDLDASELLHNLDGIYKESGETHDFSKNLPTYLQYCNDVVFAGSRPSFKKKNQREVDIEEETTRKLWDFYQNEKDSGQSCADLNRKRSREGATKILEENKKSREDRFDAYNETCHSSQRDQCSESKRTVKMQRRPRDEAIRRLKVDMDENRFCYVPPRVNLKRFDYLHYARKKDEGALTYIAHADYYILLRACAKVVEIDIRSLHFGVLSFERRLAWLESRIEHCLHLTPPDESCERCSYVPCPPPDVVDDDDPIGLSDVSL